MPNQNLPEECVIEAILKIANHPNMKESDVAYFFHIEKWHVVRVLKATELLLRQLEENELKEISDITEEGIESLVSNLHSKLKELRKTDQQSFESLVNNINAEVAGY